MKKVCFITTVSLTLRTFFLPQIEYIKEKHKDWEIYCICDSDDTVNQFGDSVTYIPIKITRGASLSGISSVISLLKVFRKYKFDMIVYSTPNAAFYSSIAGKLAGVKKRLYCQWGIRYVGFSGKARKLFKAIENITCKLSTHINAVSVMNRQFAIYEKLYPEKKATVVGNGGTIGVDLSDFQLSEYDELRNKVRTELGVTDQTLFGFVGRICKDKGSKELLEAVKMFDDNDNIKLVCVGGDELNSGDIPESLLDWAKESDRIIFTGEVPPEVVKGYYAAFDVLVHPTYREGFGMVLQEAGAMRCPIITTKIPGASEVMDNGSSCLLIPVKDSEALFDVMKKISSDKSLCEEMGKNARLKVEECYERNLMLNNQLERYESLLEA